MLDQQLWMLHENLENITGLSKLEHDNAPFYMHQLGILESQLDEVVDII